MKRVALTAVLALSLGGCQGLVIPASLVAGAAVGASVMAGLEAGVGTVDEVKKDLGPPADCDTLDVLAQKFWGCYQPPPPPKPHHKHKRHHGRAHMLLRKFKALLKRLAKRSR